MNHCELEIKNLKNEIEILRNTQQTAMLGWWSINFSTQHYLFSDLLRNMAGLTVNEMTFVDFRPLIHPDDYDRIIRNAVLFCDTGVYEERFRIKTKYGYRWVNSKLGKKEINKEGEIVAYGYMRFLDDTEVVVMDINDSEMQIKESLEKYSVISSSIINLLNNENTDEAIIKTLHDILDLFKGDRVYIFEYNNTHDSQNCTYEVTSSHVEPAIDGLQNIPISSTPWWSQEIFNRTPIILNSLDELPIWAVNEKELLANQNINSVFVVPLVAKERAFGYIGIDIVHSSRLWSRLDKQWLTSIASMISMCLEMKHAVKTAYIEQKRFNELYENMPMGFVRLKVIYDKNGVPIDYLHLDANSSVEVITGIKSELFLGKLGSELGMISKERLDFFESIFRSQSALSDSNAYGHNGRYYAYTAYPTSSDELVVIFHDNTDKVITHNDLVKSRTKLNKIFQNVPMGIEIYNKDGILMEMNDADVEIFGVVREEVIGKVTLFNNPNVPKHYVDELLKGNNIDFELLYDYNDVRKNNFFRTKCTDVKHLSVKSSMLYDSNNELESIILVIADNTETITSNNKLAEFELLFDSMSEFAGIGLGRYNMVRDRFEVSDQWCANLCKTQQEIGTFAQTYSNMYADDLALIARNFRAIRDGQIDNFCSEVKVHDGEKDKWLKCHYKISRRNHNAPNEMELVGLNIDITSQKNTENSLIEAKTKAEESDRLKSAFLANMSHEIRTPLNAIVGFSDMLVDTTDPEEKMQYVSIIKQNNELLLQLISDILDISKIESGIISVTPSKFDVNVMCEEIVRSNSIKAPAGVELIFDRHKEPFEICSDKNKLIQILTNFIGNGMKFTKKGTIRLGYQIDESSVSFYVKDSGIGIDNEHLYSIFDRFVKLNSFVQGSGLGLSICRSLTDKLHGRIWAESEPGKGSCFWVSLPYDYEHE